MHKILFGEKNCDNFYPCPQVTKRHVMHSHLAIKIANFWKPKYLLAGSLNLSLVLRDCSRRMLKAYSSAVDELSLMTPHILATPGHWGPTACWHTNETKPQHFCLVELKIKLVSSCCLLCIPPLTLEAMFGTKTILNENKNQYTGT